MKAKIKKTGEIIEIASYAKITLDMCDSWGNPIEVKPEEIELIQDSTDDFDWQSFRAETAKDVMCAIINGSIAHDSTIMSSVETLVGGSIWFADELIRQLKGGK